MWSSVSALTSNGVTPDPDQSEGKQRGAEWDESLQKAPNNNNNKKAPPSTTSGIRNQKDEVSQRITHSFSPGNCSFLLGESVTTLTGAAVPQSTELGSSRLLPAPLRQPAVLKHSFPTLRYRHTRAVRLQGSFMFISFLARKSPWCQRCSGLQVRHWRGASHSDPAWGISLLQFLWFRVSTCL